ncbi:hypothetical protein BH11BAC2_BH11BAC2_17100 [soil metagenome]
MALEFTGAPISDSSGNLLFYTNGVWIADASNDTMQNGNGLNRSSYTTSVYNTSIRVTGADVVLPDPGNINQYYLIHETPGDIDTPFPDYIYYSLINKTLNNGLGVVTVKNQILVADTLLLGQKNVCRHANGRDWWVMLLYTTKLNSGCYFVKVTSDFGATQTKRLMILK